MGRVPYVVERDRRDPLAGRGDGVRDFLGRDSIGANDERGRDVRITPQSDQLRGVRLPIRAVPAPSVRRGEEHRAGNAHGHPRRSACDKSVQTKDQDAVAHAVPSVAASIT